MKKLINRIKKLDMNKIKRSIYNNQFFYIFLAVNILNDFILRYMTMKSLKIAFGVQPFFADLFFLAIIGGFVYLFKKKKSRLIYLSIITVLCTIICIVNSIYYTFYTSFSSVSLLSNLKYAAQVGDAVTENVMKVTDYIYIIPLIIYFILMYRYNKKGFFKNSFNRKRNLKYFVNNLILVGVSFLGLLVTLKPVDYSRLIKQWNREYLVGRFGIYIYHVNDGIKSLEPKIVSFFGYDNAYKEFNDYFKDAPKKQAHKNKYTGIYKDKNIIAIHAESIQNWVIGKEFNGVELTPNLNRISKESLYFDNFYAEVGVGTSSDTEFTTLTSLMPTNVGTAFVSYFNRTYNTVLKSLKAQGYRTLSFHGNTASFWNRNAMYKSLGYDRFYSKKDFNIDEVLGLGLSDTSFFKQTVPILKKEQDKHGKFYATVIMLSNHTPFYDVSKYIDIELKKTKKVMNKDGVLEDKTYDYLDGTKLGRYIKSVRYADLALGKFFEELDAAGLLENTVVVIYGDHDARLPRRDYIKMENFDYSNKDNEFLSKDDPGYKDVNKYDYELNRKVPLIFWTKDKKIKKKVSYPMGTYNYAPTLGNMMGFYNPYALGKDIFEVRENNVVPFVNGSWLDKNIYYDSQGNVQYPYNPAPISNEYITKTNHHVNELLKVSNNMIIYDLIDAKDKNKIPEREIIKNNEW